MGLSGQEIFRHRVTSEVADLRKLAVWKLRTRNLGMVRAGLSRNIVWSAV